jgi:hypothetical protein
VPFEKLEDRRVYQRAEAIADQVWGIVNGWDWFPKRVMGAQFAAAADSIGANIAEAGGRFHPADVKKVLLLRARIASGNGLLAPTRSRLWFSDPSDGHIHHRGSRTTLARNQRVH